MWNDDEFSPFTPAPAEEGVAAFLGALIVSGLLAWAAAVWLCPLLIH